MSRSFNEFVTCYKDLIESGRKEAVGTEFLTDWMRTFTGQNFLLQTKVFFMGNLRLIDNSGNTVLDPLEPDERWTFERFALCLPIALRSVAAFQGSPCLAMRDFQIPRMRLQQDNNENPRPIKPNHAQNNQANQRNPVQHNGAMKQIA